MKKTFKKHSRAPRVDIYERVTEIVLKRLEEGVAPWQAPSIARVGFPKNFLTKNGYQGINVFLLGSAGYVSPWFLSYKQACGLDGQVRKGEKGHLIVKYGTFEKESASVNSKSSDAETMKRGYLRGYTVFNSSQIDGINFPGIKHPEYKPSEQVALAQEIIDEMQNPPKLEEGPHACPHYRPAEDLVGMPSCETFTTEERFYKTPIP